MPKPGTKKRIPVRKTPQVRMPPELEINHPEIARMMAYEGEMPKAEFQALCRKYGTIIFEALLQQGTARPVVCPHCNEAFEVLIRDTSALKALMEQGFGKAHQTKKLHLDDQRAATDPAEWSDGDLDDFISEYESGQGAVREGEEGKGDPPVQ